MTDAASDIEFLKQEMRLLERRLCDAEREIEDLNHANDRQVREIEDLRRHALMFGDYERPEVLAQALEEQALRSWPMARRQALADLIRPPSI